MLQIWDIRREQCLHAQQLRKSVLIGIQCVSNTQIMVTTADCVEVWNVERVKRPKNAHGHEGDVIGVVIIGPCPEKEKANRPLSAAENMPNIDNLAVNPESGTTEINLSPEELENKLRNLNTVMYSAGIDNSIRAWDIATMSCRGKFENDGESSLSEISTLTYIPGTRALITGHHNGALYWWNTDNASNTRLPQAHTEAVTKIHHYAYGNKEILFSVSVDGVLAVYDIESKMNERIFHWQKSTLLSEEHTMSSIASNEKYCYVGSSNGNVYVYDIEMCHIAQEWTVSKGTNIVDLQTDANFLFIACEFGDVIIWELTLGFAIDKIRNIHHGKQRPKCVGLYFHCDSNLMVIIFEMKVVVYDYVLGTVSESVDCRDCIASYTFYNGSLFCGCKTSVITKIRLKSFPSIGTTTLVKQVASGLVSQTRGRLKSKARDVIKSQQNAKRRALEQLLPQVEWNRGDRGFIVKFNDIKK